VTRRQDALCSPGSDRITWEAMQTSPPICHATKFISAASPDRARFSHMPPIPAEALDKTSASGSNLSGASWFRPNA